MFGALKFMFGYFPQEAELNKLADAKMKEIDILFNGDKLEPSLRKLTYFRIKEDVRQEAQLRRTVALLTWIITFEAIGGAALGGYLL